ncbi:MAG: NifB/NifX family molybdenum-iron cluster-binding protein, partial [Desulfatitalea sp.]
HIEAIAQKVAALGVDLFNCMPYYPSKGSALEHLAEPDKASVAAIRKHAGRYVKQMSHCTRCRADAVGLLGEAPSPKLMETLNSCQHLSDASLKDQPIPTRPYVAVATMEGVLVNQHLGEADKLLIYCQTGNRIGLIEARPTPEPGSGMARWQQLADMLKDCRVLLVSGVGANPEQVLGKGGIEVIACEGLIEEAVRRVYAGENLKAMAVRKPRACGSACAGDMMGCGG